MSASATKKTTSVIIIYAIFFLVYLSAFFILPFEKTAVSWISFFFTLVAIGSNLYVFLYALGARKNIMSLLYGYPIYKVSTIYTLVQLITGILFCAAAAFVSVPYWLVLLVDIVLLAAAAIGVIITDNTRDIAEAVDERAVVDTKNMSQFGMIVSSMVTDNAVLKAELEKLRDAIRFSDPVSSSATLKKEEKLRILLTELSSLIKHNNENGAREMIKIITRTLAERNQLCKEYKGR